MKGREPMKLKVNPYLRDEIPYNAAISLQMQRFKQQQRAKAYNRKLWLYRICVMLSMLTAAFLTVCMFIGVITVLRVLTKGA